MNISIWTGFTTKYGFKVSFSGAFKSVGMRVVSISLFFVRVQLTWMMDSRRRKQEMDNFWEIACKDEK